MGLANPLSFSLKWPQVWEAYGQKLACPKGGVRCRHASSSWNLLFFVRLKLLSFVDDEEEEVDMIAQSELCWGDWESQGTELNVFEKRL